MINSLALKPSSSLNSNVLVNEKYINFTTILYLTLLKTTLCFLHFHYPFVFLPYFTRSLLPPFSLVPAIKFSVFYFFLTWPASVCYLQNQKCFQKEFKCFFLKTTMHHKRKFSALMLMLWFSHMMLLRFHEIICWHRWLPQIKINGNKVNKNI